MAHADTKALPHPDAVIKHDGRSVAFDASRLELSIAHSAGRILTAEAALRLGRQVAGMVAFGVLADGKRVVATSDIRVRVLQALRDLKCDGAAEAFQDFAREASLRAVSLRVIEPEMPRAVSSGFPWDRRRLLESLRASGVAFDTAGAAAREVERRIVASSLECVTPALIHALAVLALSPETGGARAYGARRVAYSAAAHLPNWNASASAENPLPPAGAALEEFWLQGIHSRDVVAAVRDNLLALDPYPSTAGADGASSEIQPADPLSDDFFASLKERTAGTVRILNALADTPERTGGLGVALARLARECGGIAARGAELSLRLKAAPEKIAGAQRRAAPITLNAGGAIAREALRDPARAAARLAELAALAAKAHREREEYFLLSPVRGRVLPIAAAGLWNATAWIQGASFDATQAARGAREIIAPLCMSLSDAVNRLCGETSMNLLLTAAAPEGAERRLWRGDQGHFLRDGIALNAASAYDSGTELKLSAAMDDFINRLDFAKALSEAFDEPPELRIVAPLSVETTAAQWSELFDALAKAGIARLRLAFGGVARSVPNLTRAVREYLIGFPLLEPGNPETPKPKTRNPSATSQSA